TPRTGGCRASGRWPGRGPAAGGLSGWGWAGRRRARMIPGCHRCPRPSRGQPLLPDGDSARRSRAAWDRPGRLGPTVGPLPPEVPQALVEEAGTERGGCTTHDTLGNGVLMLGAELPRARYDRVRRRVKSLGKGPGAARGIVRPPDHPGGYGDWRCGDGDGVGPESTRLLHLQLLSRGLPETTRLRRKYKAAPRAR